MDGYVVLGKWEVVEEEGVEDNAQADAGESSQETVEVATAVAQPAARAVEGQSWHEGELDIAGRDDGQIRIRLEHAKRVRDQATGDVGVKEHAVVFLGEDARQNPALVGLARQQRG